MPEDTFSNIKDPGSNPLEVLIEKLDRERRIRAAEIIREMTSELSDEDQILVKLVYGSDHSAAAAAKVLGISPPAARKRLKSLLIKYKAALLAEGIREYGNHEVVNCSTIFQIMQGIMKSLTVAQFSKLCRES